MNCRWPPCVPLGARRRRRPAEVGELLEQRLVELHVLLGAELDRLVEEARVGEQFDRAVVLAVFGEEARAALQNERVALLVQVERNRAAARPSGEYSNARSIAFDRWPAYSITF